MLILGLVPYHENSLTSLWLCCWLFSINFFSKNITVLTMHCKWIKLIYCDSVNRNCLSNLRILLGLALRGCLHRIKGIIQTNSRSISNPLTTDLHAWSTIHFLESWCCGTLLFDQTSLSFCLFTSAKGAGWQGTTCTQNRGRHTLGRSLPRIKPWAEGWEWDTQPLVYPYILIQISLLKLPPLYIHDHTTIFSPARLVGSSRNLSSLVERILLEDHGFIWVDESWCYCSPRYGDQNEEFFTWGHWRTSCKCSMVGYFCSLSFGSDGFF